MSNNGNACPQCGNPTILSELVVFGSREWKRYYCLICSREYRADGKRVVSEERRQSLSLCGDRRYRPARWRTNRPDFITL